MDRARGLLPILAAEQTVDDELFGGAAAAGSGPTADDDPRAVDLPVSAFEHDLTGYNTVVYFKGADALIGAPASVVRHWPIASKFSRLSPSGSIRA